MRQIQINVLTTMQIQGAVLPIIMCVDFFKHQEKIKKKQNTKENHDGMRSIIKGRGTVPLPSFRRITFILLQGA